MSGVCRRGCAAKPRLFCRHRCAADPRLRRQPAEVFAAAAVILAGVYLRRCDLTFVCGYFCRRC